MKRAVSIDDIIFNYPLLVSDNYNSDDYVGSLKNTTGGKLVDNSIIKGSLTKKISLLSGDGGWIDFDTKKKLIENIDTSVKIVKFNDDSSINYNYDLEKPLEFEEIYQNAKWYKIKINLMEK